MKFVSFFLAFFISFNVLANSGTIQEFEKAFDNYQYSLIVEWDQKDEAFFNAKTNEFNSHLKGAFANGLTQEQLLTFLESKIQNKKALEAIKLKASLLPKDLSQEELMIELKDASKDIYSQGASWNGDTVLAVVFGALFVYMLSFAARAIYQELTHECVKTESRYSCTDRCSLIDNYCRNDCGYSDVCLEWVKK